MKLIKTPKEFFKDDLALDRLHVELESWVGTPYKHWEGVKQRGADCIHFVARALDAVGSFQGRKIIIPKYAQDWHLHHGEEILREGIEKQFPVIPIGNKDDVTDGDIVLFEFGLQASHIGVYYKGQVYQALTDMGIHVRDWTDPDFYDRITYIYRIVKI